MPKEFYLESLIEKFVFIKKVEEGLKQAVVGKTVLHNEVKEMIDKW